MDVYGKCPSPYIYSTENKVCVSNPICPGAYVWNAQTKQCESVNVSGGSESPGYTMPDNSCAVDLNGNGDVEKNEIFACTQTPQGYICSQGLTPCNPQYQQPSCPSGYTYNSQTQKCEATVTQGVCSSRQVPVTDYQCPTNGQIYSDLTTCNNNCLQTAQCFPQYQQPSCPSEYTYNSQTQKCESTVFEAGNCAPATGYTAHCWRWCERCQYYCTSPLPIRLPYARNGDVVAGGGRYHSWNNCDMMARFVCSNGSWVKIEDINLCYASSCWNPAINYISYAPLPPQYSFLNNYKYYCYENWNSSYWSYTMGGYNYNITPLCVSGGTYNSSTGKCELNPTCSTGTLQPQGCFTGYSCPLGSYSCSGNPPTCTKGQTCVTHSSTVTKWQCSLNGVQYDTQNQCTTSCHTACPAGGTYNPSTGKCEATATCSTGTLQPQGCFTGYGCPLGNYQCQQVNNQWMCSSYQCITQNQLQDEGDVIPSGYEDDGPRDEQGNCLGTIYIFNGKGMRCRKSGVDTGFHNCCNESRGKLYDSTGSIGGGVGNLGKVAETIAGVYQAINVGTFTVKSLSANYAIITFNNGVVDKVVHPVAGTLTGTQAQAWVDGMIKQGALTYGNPVSGGMTVRIDTSISADTLTASTMSEYLKQSGLANSVVGLATSMIIKDPVLSSAVNVAAQSILVALEYGSVLNIATAVVGLAMALFMKKCDQQDIMTSTFNDSGYCHEVGEYCIKKWKFVGCVQKAKGFCCFNSKLARIIHEQGRPQLKGFQPNGAWGDPKSPNCRGFLPEEFQALDFNKIDLSEYIEDIQRNIRQNLEPQLKQQVQQNWGR
ncbi:conjugal transfer protein TraN [Thermodesulfovibrio sp. 3907-1M]|uniref:Conjugal transfer protein TraN n=1 Tax=Thermodesulfovibrio autotrophicus TaxID=3118333 RepID=A0AAU8GZ48_9BACT